MTKKNTLQLLTEIQIARTNLHVMPEILQGLQYFKEAIKTESAPKYPLAIIRAGRKLGFFYKQNKEN